MKNLWPLLAFIILFSCDDSKDTSDTLLPEATGEHGQVLVVMDDNLWNGDLGNVVQENFNQTAKGPYLRPESMFSYYHKEPDDLNHIHRVNRLIVKFMLASDTTFDNTQYIRKENYYAKNQIFIIVKDSDFNRLYYYAKDSLGQMVNDLNNFELKQLSRFYKESPNNNVLAQCQEKFGIYLAIPKNSEVKISRDDFILVKRDRSKNLLRNDATKARGGVFWIQQGFMVWQTPFNPDSSLTIDYALRDRDSTLKKNVAGSVKGTYMATEYDPYYKPKGKLFIHEGREAIELSGLWIYDGPVFVGGGGPFAQYSILSKDRKTLTTVSGYVYAPKFDKREYIRELYAVLSSISFETK